MKGRPDTFLPFMEDWWSGMIYAFFLRVSECLPTTLVDAFRGHFESRVKISLQEPSDVAGQ